MPKVLIILLLFIAQLKLCAQILPKEGSRLNYRIIGFSFTPTPGASGYKIEIADGIFNNTDSFTRHIILSAVTADNRVIGEVPAFGKQYTWRVIYTLKRKKASSPFYHFTTLTNAHADTARLHLRILQPAAAEYKDNFVTLEAGGVLYDMTGNPVWFIPGTNEINGNISDLKFTAEGTITYINNVPYEINYNGDTLWKTSDKGIISGDTANGEGFHHEFTRLFNGHYMILGTQTMNYKVASAKDSSYFIVSDNKQEQKGQRMGRFGTLIEYDENGNITWSWNSLKYLTGYDLAYFESKIDTNKRFPHDNAFLFDENTKCIYLGFKNMNRIIKIEYPSGKVLCIYGENYMPGGMPATGAGLFCNQHSIELTHDGYLCVFNNNSCGIADSLPAVVMLQEPVSPNGPLKKVWEYTCTIDGYYPPGNRKVFASGGNAIELADGALFVNMGSEYSKMFIVNRNKKVLWSALPERFMETDQKWTAMHEYRSNIINRKDLERLIWDAERTGKLKLTCK